jgi:hypothetical protein
MRSGQSTRGAEYAVAPELGWLDEVRVDVYDIKRNRTVLRARGEPLEHVVAGTVLGLVPSSLKWRLENSSCRSQHSSMASMWGKRLL